MVVGTDERRYAVDGEGLNTFIDTYESDAFQGGVYGPKRDAGVRAGRGPPADQIAALIADPKAPPIMTRADSIAGAYGHPISYFKTAFGLRLLREDILGPERFDPAFRKFIRDWAYKHPQPSDFFRAMESEGGEDLSWFWRGWFFNNWQLDLAVTGVSLRRRRPGQGRAHRGQNLGQLVLPATMRIKFKDGTTRESAHARGDLDPVGRPRLRPRQRPADRQVVIDPDHRLPERDRSNTVWTAPADAQPAHTP